MSFYSSPSGVYLFSENLFCHFHGFRRSQSQYLGQVSTLKQRPPEPGLNCPLPRGGSFQPHASPGARWLTRVVFVSRLLLETPVPTVLSATLQSSRAGPRWRWGRGSSRPASASVLSSHHEPLSGSCQSSSHVTLNAAQLRSTQARPLARLRFQPPWRQRGPQALATAPALCGPLPQPLLPLSSGARAVRMVSPDLPALLPEGRGPPWSSQPPKSFPPAQPLARCPPLSLWRASLLPAADTVFCRHPHPGAVAQSRVTQAATPAWPCPRAVPGCGTASLSTDLPTCRL